MRQDLYFPIRLPFANKNIRDINYSIVNTTYISAEDKIINLRSLAGKTNLKLYKHLSNYYDEMNIRKQTGNFEFEEDFLSKNFEGIGKFYHEVLLLKNFVQTKPQVKDMNIISI